MKREKIPRGLSGYLMVVDEKEPDKSVEEYVTEIRRELFQAFDGHLDYHFDSVIHKALLSFAAEEVEKQTRPLIEALDINCAGCSLGERYDGDVHKNPGIGINECFNTEPVGRALATLKAIIDK